MKNRTIFPRLVNNQTIEIAGERYRANWYSTRVYHFEYLGDNGKENFTMSEQVVSEAIKTNKIKTVNP